MELLFVRSVNVSGKNKDAILKNKLSNNYYLSAHGSYYVNLNADALEKQDESRKRILDAVEALSKAQGRCLILHPGYYLNHSKEKTYDTIKTPTLHISCNIYWTNWVVLPWMSFIFIWEESSTVEKARRIVFLL